MYIGMPALYCRVISTPVFFYGGIISKLVIYCIAIGTPALYCRVISTPVLFMVGSLVHLYFTAGSFTVHILVLAQVDKYLRWQAIFSKASG